MNPAAYWSPAPVVSTTFWTGSALTLTRSPWLRITEPAAPQVMAALRNAAVSLLRLLGVTNIAEALRANPYRVPDVLAEMGIVNL